MLGIHPPVDLVFGQPRLPDISLAADDIQVVYASPPLMLDTLIPSPSATEVAFVRHGVSLAKSILLNFRFKQAAISITP